MNRRQKKKQYKKIHGHNPPKVVVGLDLAQGTDLAGYYKPPEPIITPEQAQVIVKTMKTAFAGALETLSKTAGNLSEAFKNYAEGFREVTAEEPCVVTARKLSERRKERCRRNGYRASRR